jgi:hypothetical protein
MLNPALIVRSFPVHKLMQLASNEKYASRDSGVLAGLPAFPSGGKGAAPISFQEFARHVHRGY